MSVFNLGQSEAHSLRVFLCHSSRNKPAVRRVYRRLRAEGFAPWIDEKNLNPGQDWELEIGRAVEASHAILVFLSARAVNAAGYLHKELRKALDVADLQPEDSVFIIPVRLERCSVPKRLQRYQYVDLFLRGGLDRLIVTLRTLVQPTVLSGEDQQESQPSDRQVQARVGTPHEDRPAKRIQLYLHAETPAHRDYNENVRRGVEAASAVPTTLNEASQLQPDWFWRFTSGKPLLQSGPNDLMVVQVDEFWVNRQTQPTPVVPLPEPGSQAETGQLSLPPASVVRTASNGIAVPYYFNPSLLVFRADIFTASDMGTWHDIAVACDNWRSNYPDGVAFDFAASYGEDYNCLYLEILRSLRGTAENGRSLMLSSWLSEPEALEAALLMRRLCRPAHLAKVARRNKSNEPKLALDHNAVVWRHWYNTFHQLLDDFGPSKHENLVATPLPGNTSTAGEWYLAIPSQSAAPEHAMEIITALTTTDAEIERLSTGIGLPTRSQFYTEIVSPMMMSDVQAGAGWQKQLAYLSIDSASLRELVRCTFKRSSLQCYLEVANSFSHHLQRVIEIPDTQPGALVCQVQAILTNLVAQLHFLENARTRRLLSFGTHADC